jgi:hypothetical protein
MKRSECIKLLHVQLEKCTYISSQKNVYETANLCVRRNLNQLSFRGPQHFASLMVAAKIPSKGPKKCPGMKKKPINNKSAD